MTAKDDANGDQRGIRVGETTYLLRDAAFSTPSGSVLQVLVLKRATLEFVSNRKYLSGAEAAEDLAGLDASMLVILVLQPGGLAGYQYGGLDEAVRRIGAPDMGASLPLNTGLMSVVGVPGMDPGDAEVNILTGSTGRIAPMKGYLMPDRWGNFGFVPSERKPFSFAPPTPQVPCNPRDCPRTGAGFRVRHLDSRTLAPAGGDGEIYITNSSFALNPAQKDEREAERMAADLAAFPPDDVVMIEAVSHRLAADGNPPHLPPIGSVHLPAMVRLATEIAQIGGTRNAFNRTATMYGAVASGGMTYVLVGWKGAGEGAGMEVAAGFDGAGWAPSLSGMLRPDRQSRFRPMAADPTPEALSNLVMAEPTTAWPLADLPCRPAGLKDDDPGAARALTYLGSTDDRLGSDPRSAYATQHFKEASTWNEIARAIEAETYAGVPADTRDAFTETQFLAARCQLVTELRWVANVRLYLEDLASPISDSSLLAYSRVREIGNRIYEETHSPDDNVGMHWAEFVQIMLEIAGPLTHDVSASIAAVMELGVWAADGEENGEPNNEIPFAADKLADKLVERMQDAVKTYDSIGDIIVTDSAKLRFVGMHGNCNPAGGGTCPTGYSFTAADQREASADIHRTVERLAYEELLPLGFHVFGLNPERLRRPPDPRWYNCTTEYPWWYYSDTAVSLATTPLLLERDRFTPESNNLWKLLVLSRPKPGNRLHGEPPSDETLKRVFGKVDNSTDPTKGGLGASPIRLMSDAKWELWYPDDRPDRRHLDRCS